MALAGGSWPSVGNSWWSVTMTSTLSCRARVMGARAAAAAVDGDEELGSGFDELADGVGVEAVAFVDAVGDVVIDVGSGGFEGVPEHGGAGDAVDVVVAIEGDFFVGADGVNDAIGGGVHVGEEIGGEEVFEFGVEEGGGGGFRGGEAAVDEDAGDEGGVGVGWRCRRLGIPGVGSNGGRTHFFLR